MYEQACEDNGSTGNCDTDQTSFKAYLSRWLAATVKIAPFTRSKIMPWLQASAAAAALQCDADNDATCGLHWTWNSTNDGLSGVGEQMAGLAIIQANLIDEAVELVTNDTGGTSVGNSNAGTGSSSSGSSGTVTETTVTTAGKAGAGVLTAVMLMGVIAGTSFLILGA